MKQIAFVAMLFATLAFSALLYSQGTRDSGRGSFMDDVGPFGKFEEVLPIGSPAPDFSLKTVDGKEVSLQSLRGRIVVLESGART